MNGPSSARLKNAIEVALPSLRGFPRDRATRDFIGTLLFGACHDDTHLGAVVNKLLENDSWPGPGTLRRTALELRSSAGAPTEWDSLKAKWKSERPADDCPRCCAGMLQQDGVWIRCACRWGQRVTDQELESYNGAFGRQEGRLQTAGNPAEFEQWPADGRLRDRELARKRREMTRERREAEDGGTIQ